MMMMDIWCSEKRAQILLCLAMVCVLVLAGAVRGDIVDEDRKNCVQQVIPLIPCLKFIKGDSSESSPEAAGCCNPLQDLIERNMSCVCILLLDSQSSSQRGLLNSTRFLMLPSLCHCYLNVYNCIGLLNIPPKSANANRFMQLAGAMNNLSGIQPSESPTSSGYEIDIGRRKCVRPFLQLDLCLNFIWIGGGQSSPTSSCCNQLENMLETNNICICVLILDSRFYSIIFHLNLTRMILLPSLCHHPVDFSSCTGILNLPPKSAEANAFRQYSGVRECLGHWRCHKRRNLALVLGSLSVISLALMLSIIAYKKHKLSMHKNPTLRKERKGILSTNSEQRLNKLFSGKEIKRATNCFAKEMLLGTGAYGDVYKGFLEDGTAVAVKMAKVNCKKSTEQILNELSILSQVNHRYLVRLLGCCIDLKEPLLIYEFIANGTLYDHLHTDKYGFLNWDQRLKIAHQAAEALAYLHSSANSPIYHRDVKSGNILLDENCNAKVSDFGLSRLANPDDSHVSTCVHGTMGYLDPEYYRTYKLTDKSDVYSFGVVLLELLTSKKVLDYLRGDGDANLVGYVRNMVGEGRTMDAIDTNLSSGASSESLEAMKELCSLAFRCLEEKSPKRPSMKEVVQEIKYLLRTERIAALFGR